MAEQQQQEILTLAELLEEIRSRHLILLRDARLWAPNTRVPAALRQAIHQHHEALKPLLEQGDIRLCPNPDLHRKHGWSYAGQGSFVCDTCRRLGPAIQKRAA